MKTNERVTKKELCRNVKRKKERKKGKKQDISKRENTMIKRE